MNDHASDIQDEGATLQICKIGDSVGVVLPKEFVTRLNLKEGDKLYPVQQPDGSIRLAPYNPKHARAMEIARKMMREYRDTFAALAK
jgi:putative addiction module antidote